MMSRTILDRVLLYDVSLLLREKVTFFFLFVNTLLTLFLFLVEFLLCYYRAFIVVILFGL